MPATAPTSAVRAVRLALDGTVAPEHAALLVRDDDRPFALAGRWAGSAAIVGSAPVRVCDPDDDPFATLDDLPCVDDAPAGFVGGGWVGMLGYGLGTRIEALHPAPAGAPERLPAAALAYYDHVLRLDREGTWWFEALWTDARAAELEARLADLRRRLAAHAPPQPRRPVAGPWRVTPSPAGHARAVAACRDRIAAGDLFQANLSLRLRARLEGDPVELFAAGVAALRPDRAAWLAGDWGAVASLSPELFVERRGDEVRSAPIKGTRPRPDDHEAAARHRLDLEASAKDRAENIMIVDLVRNDLGRVCEHGSVTVTALAEARAHAGVWHLVSEVTGRRRDDVGDGELVRALFPPGSVTGAPKLAAMNVVSELEGHARQAFCGAIGFASPCAGLELSVAIRTFECVDGHVWLDVGGGVVADSDPAAEAAECLAKAEPLLRAIGAVGGIEMPSGTGADPPCAADPIVPQPARLGPRPIPRPDPAAGIFETLLVVDGEAVCAERHLARLAASARILYRSEPPAGLAGLVHHTATEHGGPCRLRVLLDADGGVALQVAAVPEAGGPITLEPVTVAGGLGPHKWRDRRLVDALEAHTGPALPLLVDLDGLVLETTRASVFAVVDGTLVTPPLDGRILPGVTRAHVLETAHALDLPTAERALPLSQLLDADEAFVTNALRGLQPVGTWGPVAQELAAWLPRPEGERAPRRAGQNALASANGNTGPAPLRRS